MCDVRYDTIVDGRPGGGAERGTDGGEAESRGGGGVVPTQAAARAVVTEAVTAMAAEAMPMDGRERGGGDRMLGRGAERRRLE